MVHLYPGRKLLFGGMVLGLLVANPFCVGNARADTIRLKNGHVVKGEVLPAVREGYITVQIGDVGRVFLPEELVDRVEKEELARVVPAVGREKVRVHLGGQKEAPGRDLQNGTGFLEGRIVESGEKELVLDIAGQGRVLIPKDGIAGTEQVPSEAEEVKREEKAIPTTHLVTMKNGFKIRGTVSGASTKDTLVLRIGSMGKLEIPRHRIASVEEDAGEIPIPPPYVRPKPVEVPVEPEVKEEAKPAEEVKEEALDRETRKAIDFYVYELGRQRPRNRVRAENGLIRIGSPAIPSLISIALHPNVATRRAVMRIFAAVGDERAIPAAFRALEDEDEFVRAPAASFLGSITGQTFGYRADAPLVVRRRAVERWLRYWEESQAEG